MHNKRIILLLVFICAAITSTNHELFAQWSDFKKGLTKEVQVAFESDTMLVAHYNEINFSFIATLSETSDSDIHRDKQPEAGEVWMTTERFWNRLSKTGKGLREIFKTPFIKNLHHPPTVADAIRESQPGGARAGLKQAEAEALQKESSTQLLLSQVDVAKNRGDFEVASLLLVMLKEQHGDSTHESDRLAHKQIQKTLKKQKTVADKLYRHAAAYEAADEWELAAAVYENLLELGEYKDTRERLATILPKIREAQTNLKLENMYKAGLLAIEKQEWQIAILAFERVIAEQPDFPYIEERLDLARAALKRSNEQLADDLSNGRAEPEGRIDFHDSAGAYTALDAPAGKPIAPNTDIGVLYNEAIRFVSMKEWRSAEHVLNIVASQQPTFQNTPQLQALVHANLPKDGLPGLQTIFLGATFVISLLIGSMIVFPTLRAGFYAGIKYDKKAAAIYENLLVRNPGKLKLYGKLAAVYLRSGRKDRQAFKIFETVVKLDLRIKQKERLRLLLEGKRSIESGG